MCSFTTGQQDKLYLETCARLKMTAVATSSNFKDIETFEARNKASIEYVDKLKEICITMLGIPESTIDTAPRSVELDASENFYKSSLVLRHEDALLGFVSFCFRLREALLKFGQQILCYFVTLCSGGPYLGGFWWIEYV